MEIIKQKTIKLFFIAFFYISNFFILVILSLYSKNSVIELFKFIQITGFILVFLFLLKKINKTIAKITINIIYFFYLILLAFFVLTHTKLGFDFFNRNIQDINSILSYYFWLLIFLFFVSFINSKIFYDFQSKIKNKKIYLILLIIIVIPQFLPNKYNNEFFYFINSAFKKPDIIINYYEENIRNKLIKNLELNRENIITQSKNINIKKLPNYLDNIIILQLESLNNFLINKKNTPNFIKIAKNGIFFPKFYNNSIETILGQETLLCSLPVSFYSNQTINNLKKKIICLPEILKQIGYKTFFFKTYNLKFAKTDELMEKLQFDEIHAKDIMQKNDPKYLWGYREDVFFKRVFNFFQKKKQSNKNFVFIEIGPTNHYPFSTPKDIKNKIPYKFPKNHQQKLINTTFIQDSYLPIVLENINKAFPKKNYTLLIVSDHSWPIEMHANNVFNQKHSFEENFLSSMIIIFGDVEKHKNKIINTKYSQMDIVPSMTKLFNINYPANNFSSSFIEEINNKKKKKSSNIILIQPFFDKYLNIIKNNLKYQYNSETKKFILYDLTKDSKEKNPKTIGNNKTQNMEIIKKIIN